MSKAKILICMPAVSLGSTPRASREMNSRVIAVLTTAMSGSLGVVLRPCLVVVLISVLNDEVSSLELFSNGLKVFALSAILFLIAMLFYNKEPLRMAPLGEAMPKVLRALRRFLPYIFVLVLVFALGGRLVARFAWPALRRTLRSAETVTVMRSPAAKGPRR